MEKAEVGQGLGVITLDHCPRCGGIWFERGEALRVARHQPAQLWERVPRRVEEFRAPCHGCHAPMSRADERCAACGWTNEIACPQCGCRLTRHCCANGLVLDVCRQCQGIWFDHAELEALWTLELEQAVARRRSMGSGAVIAGDVLLDALIWTPDLVVYGAYGATRVAGAAFEGLSNAPEAIAGAADVASEAAAGLFETIAEIIASIFS